MFRNRVVREGIVSGVIGASAVALWFLIIDVMNGHPLHTPQLLGTAVFSITGTPLGDGLVLPVVGYTLIHYVTFVLAGLFVTKVVQVSDDAPTILVGLFLLFAVFEVAFYAMCVVLSMFDVIGELAWYQIGAANLVASGSMGTYLWYRHPEFVPRMDAALRGTAR